MREAEVLSERIGILEHGRLLHLAPAGELLERFEAETLEEVFLASTGRSVEDDDEQPQEVTT
jgi:ABC-type multidrug transport system ATPase subunit